MNLQTLKQNHLKARDAYQVARGDGDRKATLLARRAMRQAAYELIQAQYAAGEEPSPFTAGALPYMFQRGASC